MNETSHDTREPAYLTELNEAQKRAATHTDGPLLIVAGAGAGKTKTITHRILHLVLEKGIPAEHILAVTFTNKAAREMRERVGTLLREHAPSTTSGLPFVATFHSLGAGILRESAQQVGRTGHFTIFDQNDSTALVRQLIKEAGYDPKVLEPKVIRGIISTHKNAGRGLEEAASGASSHNHKAAAEIWRTYEKRLAEQNALDFDDLLVKTVELLKQNTDIREHYQNRFRYLHVDEYQDTNHTQYELTRLLAGERQNVCVVGDADQNIYRWRGAEIGNILGFKKDFPGAETILLEENYRSTELILKAADAVIADNTERIEKTLRANKTSEEKIALLECASEYDEARRVAARAADLIDSGVNPSEIAVLYRANFQSRVMEEAFFTAGVPYQMVGTKFFDRAEIKDVLAYLRAAFNPTSADIARIAGAPPQGIGKTTLERLDRGEYESLGGKARENVDRLYAFLQEIRESARQNPPSAVITEIIQRSGLKEHLESKTDPDGKAASALENCYELASFCQKYDETENFESAAFALLEDTALSTDQDEIDEGGAVRLLTVHAAKGLEFGYVFVTGLEEDLFPNRREGEEPDRGKEEEERRLCYVAMTRAGEKLHLSHASVRTKFGARLVNTPSEFLTALKDEWLEKEVGRESWLGAPKEPSRYIFFD